MSKSEIPREQWVEFFQTFTALHAGQLSSVGMDGKRRNYEAIEVEAHELPLREIAADVKDGEDTIVISLGLSADQLLRHAVQSVAHVYVMQTENGVDYGLEIESRNDQITTFDLSLTKFPQI